MIKLSAYEKIWFVAFIAVGIVLSILWGDTAIGFIAFVTGIVCVLLAAKGSKWNYVAGVVNCVTYAWVAYHSGLFGEVGLFLGFYLPLQFIGFYFWKRNTQGDGIVVMDKLSIAKTAIIFAGSLAVVFAFGFFLSTLEGQATPYLDAFTSVFSVIAAILMLRRWREFWFLYFAVNVVSIIMWLYQLADGNPYAATMLVMWGAYLVNSVYGVYVWYKSTRGLNHA
ncbi:MAG: nicotinamide riboside transporter PnuC [Defluviitaleaceae bacterium]|nr:nicotinamide riboside transporter PnuC [Defluviitaleaceae bacterium]